MSWPNDPLLCRALTELLRMVECGGLWSAEGPTTMAVQWAKKGPLTSGQKVMLGAALALWNDEANPIPEQATIGRLAALDHRNLQAALTLTMACRIGPPAVEAWIADPARVFRCGPTCDGSWPSPASLSQALTILLHRVDLGSLWTLAGPTPQAERRLKRGALTGGQAVMLAAAFSLVGHPGEIGRHRQATIGRIAAALDQGNLHALLTLAMACRLGAQAVEVWIADPGVRRFRMAGQHCGSAWCSGAEGWPDGEARAPRESEWPFCACNCPDCTVARTLEPEKQGVVYVSEPPARRRQTEGPR